MSGILSYQRYIELFYTVRDVQEHFPLEQLTVNYSFDGLGDAGWTGIVSWQTLIVDRMTYRFGEPDFSNSTIIGYFPEGTTNFIATGVMQLPSGMYTGSIVPDSLENVPVTLVNFDFTKGTDKFSQQLLLIENWQPGIALGDPRLHPDYTPVSGLSSTLALTANPTPILFGDNLTLSAVTDLTSISPGAQARFLRETSPTTVSQLGFAPMVGTVSNFVINTETLSTGTQTFFATFAGNPAYGLARSNSISVDVQAGRLLAVNLNVNPASSGVGVNVAVSATAVIAPGFTSTSSQFITNTATLTLNAQSPNSGESQQPITQTGQFVNGLFTTTFLTTQQFVPTNINSATYTVTSANSNGVQAQFSATVTKNYTATLNWNSLGSQFIRRGSTSTQFTLTATQTVTAALEPVSVSVLDLDLNQNTSQVFNATSIQLRAQSNVGRNQGLGASAVVFEADYTPDYSVLDYVVARTPPQAAGTSTGLITSVSTSSSLTFNSITAVSTGSTFSLAGLVNTGSTAVIYTVYNKTGNTVQVDPPWYNHVPAGTTQLPGKTVVFSNPASTEIEKYSINQITELQYVTPGVPYFTGAWTFNKVRFANPSQIQINSTFKLAGGPKSPINTVFTVVGLVDDYGYFTISPAYSITSHNETEQWRRDNETYQNFIDFERNRDMSFYYDPFISNKITVREPRGLNTLVLENIPSALRQNATFVSTLATFSGTYTVTEIDPIRESIKVSPAWSSTQTSVINQWVGSSFTFTNAVSSTSTVVLGTATMVSTSTNFTTSWTRTRTLDPGTYQVRARLTPQLQLGSQAPFRYATTSTTPWTIQSAPGFIAPLDLEYDPISSTQTRITLVCRGAVSVDPDHYYVFDQPAGFYVNDVLIGTSTWIRVSGALEQRASRIINNNQLTADFEVRWAGSLNFVRTYPDQILFQPATLAFTQNASTISLSITGPEVTQVGSTSTMRAEANPVYLTNTIIIDSENSNNVTPSGTINVVIEKAKMNRTTGQVEIVTSPINWYSQTVEGSINTQIEDLYIAPTYRGPTIADLMPGIALPRSAIIPTSSTNVWSQYEIPPRPPGSVADPSAFGSTPFITNLGRHFRGYAKITSNYSGSLLTAASQTSRFIQINPANTFYRNAGLGQTNTSTVYNTSRWYNQTNPWINSDSAWAWWSNRPFRGTNFGPNIKNGLICVESAIGICIEPETRWNPADDISSFAINFKWQRIDRVNPNYPGSIPYPGLVPDVNTKVIFGPVQGPINSGTYMGPEYLTEEILYSDNEYRIIKLFRFRKYIEATPLLPNVFETYAVNLDLELTWPNTISNAIVFCVNRSNTDYGQLFFKPN